MSIISYTRNMNIVVSILILTSAIIPHFPLALVNEQSNSDKSVKFTSKFTKLVTNGVPIDVSEAPFYVRIHITDDHRNRSIICGGAAVQVNWVVTTASCVTAPNMKQYEASRVQVESGNFSDSNAARNRSTDVSLIKVPSRYANIWNLETCPEYNVCAAPAIPGTLLTFGDGGSPLYKVDCIFKSECLMGLASYSQVDSSAVILGREKEFGNSGIFFANVPYFIPWIQITIFMNS
ncbi:uncharacterized protein LOC142351851 isoform X2 [Convolutriloba macropyga]|uniref:uncharacterized protein LOC142351851 isoform X2 n=1 Tax=Convolutriloba macropyga TaxID=536237 RepID=UPI003F52063B